jgi:hypothetical protein
LVFYIDSIYNTHVKTYIEHETANATAASVVRCDATKRNQDDRLSKLMNEFSISESSRRKKPTVDPYEDDHDNKSYVYSRSHQSEEIRNKSNKLNNVSRNNNYRQFDNNYDDNDDDDDIITMMDRYK